MINQSRRLAVAILLLACSVSWAEVKIAKNCRVKNTPPGRCGWCALETLARHHQLKALYKLTEKYACRSSADSLEECLTGTGITYRVQHAGEFNQAVLKYAIRENLGAAVGFREIYPGAGGHIVTLVEFTEDTVKVIDSNDKDLRTRTMTTESFLYWWDGFALVLETKKSESKDLLAAAKRK